VEAKLRRLGRDRARRVMAGLVLVIGLGTFTVCMAAAIGKVRQKGEGREFTLWEGRRGRGWGRRKGGMGERLILTFFHAVCCGV
jgi:hypothetical protein